MKPRGYIAFKYKLIAIMSILVIVPIVIMGMLQYRQMDKTLENAHKKEIELISQRITDSIAASDLSYYIYEKKLEETMKNISEELKKEYDIKKSFEEINLNKYINMVKGIEINVISKSDHVIYSTDKNYIQLDCKLWPEMQLMLDATRKSDEFFTDRTRLSLISNTLKKFTYDITKNKQFIINIGVDIAQNSKSIGVLDFNKNLENIKKTNKEVYDITMFSYKGKAFVKKATDGSTVWVYYKYKKEFDKAVKTGKRVDFVGEFKGKQAEYSYIPVKPLYSSNVIPTNIIEVIFNDAEHEKSLEVNRTTALSTIIIATLIAAFLGTITSFSITKPIGMIARAVNNYAKGNLEEKVKIKSKDEFGILSEDVNRMAFNINNLILETSALYEETAAMNEELNTLYEELKRNYLTTIYALANAIEASDSYTRGHCERVTQYSLLIANALGINANEVLTLKFAALLHDVGKIGIPSTVIGKEGKLTNEEFELIKQHPRIGAEIIKDIEFLEVSKRIIYQHHERYDGSGYPEGIKGEEIELLARILSIADAYDAMTSSRPYRKHGLTKAKAKEQLLLFKGKQFDPYLTDLFLQEIDKDNKIEIL